jgi:hypothetical protein
LGTEDLTPSSRKASRRKQQFLGKQQFLEPFPGLMLNEPVTYYWDFDNPANFAADGPTPGEYLFSTGQSGPVGKQADGVQAQVKADGVQWA